MSFRHVEINRLEVDLDFFVFQSFLEVLFLKGPVTSVTVVGGGRGSGG